MAGQPWGAGATAKSAQPARGYADDGSPYSRHHPDGPQTGQGGEIEGPQAIGMREIVFLVTAEQPGRIEATAPERGIVVEAPSLEELHHEARDALIRQIGPSHATYRIRIRRAGHAPGSASGDPTTQRHPLGKPRPIPTAKPAGEGLGAAGCTATQLLEALVTGSSRGINRPMAMELARMSQPPGP